MDNVLYIKLWFIYFLSSNTSLEHTLDIIFAFSHVHGARAVNQINSLGESDVLPDFGLSWDWSGFANFSLFKCVDYTRFSNIRISHKTNADIFFVSVENIELPEQVD